MIPKIIHYCWFGKNEKSTLLLNCIKSWQKYCPDYEIIEWNESNFDVNFSQYTSEAYNSKKWAFLSDVARLWAVYNFGGIYLDTDVELNNSLDSLLSYNAWFASEDVKSVNTGMGFGAQKHNTLVYNLLKDYDNAHIDHVPCTVRNTKVISSFLIDFKMTYESQIIDNILFIGLNDYPKYARHYFAYSWGTPEEQERHRKKQSKSNRLKWKLQCLLRNPRLVSMADAHPNNIISKIYIFFVYDLIDNGILYFIKRKLIIRFKE